MNIKRVWFVFFLAIVSLLTFQAIWLYNTYYIKKGNLEKEISSLFIKSIEKEVTYRNELIECKEGLTIMDEKEFYSDSTFRGIDISNAYQVSEQELIESSIFQHILASSGIFLNINTLDSIFQSELQGMNLSLFYSLCYKDSTGVILEQTGNLSQSKIKTAFHTEPLLIVDGKRMQAIVEIKPAAVFKHMMWLLIASFIALVILLFCIVYQTKTIFTQRKLNKLREDFMHALTHDMKTPLGTINIALSNFRSGLFEKMPDKRERFGKIAMDQVASLLAIIEKILIIARLEQGKHLLNRSETDLYAITKELKERFSVSTEKQVTIHSSVDIEKDQVLFLDSTLIKDAIGNLIENAIKYSGDAVHIDLNCYINNKSLYISVKDNGFGITEKDQQLIFDKFERGAAVGRKGASGFGLGLNLVQRVAQAHGGIVMVFSKKGEGSEFSLVLPLSDPNEVDIE